MNTSFYWRDFPRTSPRRPGNYLVTFELPFMDSREVDLDTWDGIEFGYKNSVIAWMPCPRAYRDTDDPRTSSSIVMPFEEIDSLIEQKMRERFGSLIDADRSETKEEL